MSFTTTLVRIALMSVALLAMLGALALARRAGLDPEWSRKGAHVSLGLVTLTWPIVFDSAWPAVVVAALTVIVLVSLRVVPVIKRAAGCAVCGVTRRTSGDVLFPVVAAVLFAVTGGDLLLYVVPIATLTFADAAAALVGRTAGRRRYRVRGEKKSVEGSLAFFALSFVIALVGLALVSSVPSVPLAAFGYATAMTVVEAVSTGGSDNLTVPLVGAALMTVFAPDEAGLVAAILLVITLPFVARASPARRRARAA